MSTPNSDVRRNEECMMLPTNARSLKPLLSCCWRLLNLIHQAADVGDFGNLQTSTVDFRLLLPIQLLIWVKQKA